MSSEDSDASFVDSHPHYTPRWLSERLVSHLPGEFRGAIIDPACGAGNLLVAAALRMRARNGETKGCEFLGRDISIRAVRACRRTLSTLLPSGHYQVEQSDFLDPQTVKIGRPAVVVMNPPFRGYGELAKAARRRIGSLVDMKGRFNLSYVFVRRAVDIYKPETLVSLLPSNWIYSRASSFRSELDSLDGTWDWEDVGDNAFKHVNVHLGILVWRPHRNARRVRKVSGPRATVLDSGFEVRQGVATGRDLAFFELADTPLSFGQTMTAVRGRDVDRPSGRCIWVPPERATRSLSDEFRNSATPTIIDELKRRSCVRSGRRLAFEFHDPIPSWFRDTPKLILPEIVAGELRVESDSAGQRLPLHSAIAIRVPSVEIGLSLRRYLLSKSHQRTLLARAPKLSGGAVRLQVGVIRASVSQFLKLRSKAAHS